MNFFLVVAGNTVVLMTFAYLFPQHNDDNGDQLSMSISIHLDMTSDILDRLTLLWKSYTLTRCGSQRPIVEDWKYVNVLIHGHLTIIVDTTHFLDTLSISIPFPKWSK